MEILFCKRIKIHTWLFLNIITGPMVGLPLPVFCFGAEFPVCNLFRRWNHYCRFDTRHTIFIWGKIYVFVCEGEGKSWKLLPELVRMRRNRVAFERKRQPHAKNRIRYEFLVSNKVLHKLFANILRFKRNKTGSKTKHPLMFIYLVACLRSFMTVALSHSTRVVACWYTLEQNIIISFWYV